MIPLTRLERVRAAWRAFAAEWGRDEILLALALVLVSAGFLMLWPPGALLAPGLVLLWIVLPVRRPFIDRPPAAPKTKITKRGR